jgi:pimeloyl-ACP methyl ester carboxylesterase
MPRLSLETGVTLDYVDRGPRDAPVVLFVHGYLDSWRIWEWALSFLPQDYRLIALSQRGFGDSDKPAAGYTQLDYVRDLRAFMTRLGIERATIVGQSMGGLIAHHFAILHPDRVLRLVLVGTAPTAAASDIVGGSVMDDIIGLSDPVDPAFVRLAQTEQIRSPVPPEVIDSIVYESTKVPARVWREAMAGMLAENHAHRLGEIRCPTLVLYGDGDIFFTREDQDRLVQAIPDCRLKVYPGVGHGVHWEKPREFARDLAAFLAA